MFKILKYIKPYALQCVLAPLFKLLEASFELFVPLVIISMVDNGIAVNNKTHIIYMGLLLVSLAAIGLAMSITAQYFSAKAASGYAGILRAKIFDDIEHKSYKEIDSIGVTTMITRITSDVNQVQTGVNLFLRLLLRSPFVVFGAVIMAFTVNVKEALIFVVAIPLLFIIVFMILLGSIPLYKKVQSKLEDVLTLFRENLLGVRVIRAFTMEEEETEKTEKEIDNLTAVSLFVGRISSLLNPITFVVINLATYIILVNGSFLVDEGAITQGEIMALVNYMSQILVELVKFANLVITVTKSVACGDRIEAMLSEGSIEDGSEELESIESIEFKNVSFAYEGEGENALLGINLSLKKGDRIGIIGGTGSGKSTVASLLCGFYPASSGEIWVNGRNIKEFSKESLNKRISISPQFSVLFKGTVADNLKWGKEDATDDEMWKALDMASATEFIKGKDGQLNAGVKEGGSNFSGGQKQRLSIARCLIKNSDLYVLDDSTSALDNITLKEVNKNLKALGEDKILVVISQRASQIMDMDTIIVLEDGHMESMGTHEELMRSSEVYKEIYRTQFSNEE